MITGLGIWCSLGSSKEAFWDRLLRGESGIEPISFWDSSDYNVAVAAPAHGVGHETSTEWPPQSHTRKAVRLFNHAVQEAYFDAGLDQRSVASDRVGIAAGASVNYVDHRLIPPYFLARSSDGGAIDATKLEPGTFMDRFFRRQGDTMLSLPARRLRLQGPAVMMDTACAASSHAIGEALRLIQRGRADAMIAGGSAALVCPLGILAFDLIGALSRNRDPQTASRPFDKHRDGFVMGEGAGAVVLESAESARRRGARVYAELAGFGNTINAYNLTDPTPDGSGEARAISIALQDAKLPPEEVDYVAAHGTSTSKNDTAETKAIKRAFGKHASRMMVSSNKGQIGHTISAAGAMNVACAALSIAHQSVPPTIGLEHADPACDLDYVPHAGRKAQVRVAVANAFAFGGQNAVLVLRQPA